MDTLESEMKQGLEGQTRAQRWGDITNNSMHDVFMQLLYIQ
jgi:hypothetical protein